MTYINTQNYDPATAKTLPNNEKDTKKQPLCYEVWEAEKEVGGLRKIYSRSVKNHGSLHTFNHLLIKGGNRKDFTEKVSLLDNKSVNDVMIESDIEFKRLKPTQEKLTVYRCVGEKPSFFSEYKMYQKRYNTKPGDIIYMPEYAYAASDEGYAKCFMSDKNGILYEIEVPEGSRVSLTGDIKQGKMPPGNECVFPRASKFLCTDRKIMQNGNVHIKLKYIPPKEPWR